MISAEAHSLALQDSIWTAVFHIRRQIASSRRTAISQRGCFSAGFTRYQAVESELGRLMALNSREVGTPIGASLTFQGKLGETFRFMLTGWRNWQTQRT
jgi:hypothetical protein